jgi:sulfur carrier protein ThiS adenylyltransferase
LRGWAGFGNANAIKTRRITDHLTLCGDGTTDVADGVGLTASRVIICAGHMASRAVEIILNRSDSQ